MLSGGFIRGDIWTNSNKELLLEDFLEVNPRRIPKMQVLEGSQTEEMNFRRNPQEDYPEESSEGTSGESKGTPEGIFESKFSRNSQKDFLV